MRVTIEINKEEAEKLEKHLAKRRAIIARGVDSVQLTDALLSRIMIQVKACEKENG